MTDTRLEATIVGVPHRSWRWAKRCEVRVHRSDVDPRGKGYRERCEAVYGDCDERYMGPRSRLGRLLRRLHSEGVDVSPYLTLPE